MQNLIVDIKKGNREAFRELFEDYYPALCSFAHKYVQDQEKCRDIAQEVLLKYWENRHTCSTLDEVRAFLYNSVKNICFNLLKRQQVDERYVQWARGQEYEEEPVAEKLFMEQEIVLLLHKAIKGLPNQMRKIIELSMTGLRNAEIAEEIGIADGTLHTLKKMAYKKLRSELKDHFYCLFFF